jgi:hypothetical protein
MGSSVALGSRGDEGVLALAFVRGAWQGLVLSPALSLLPLADLGGKGSKRTAAWQTATSLFFSRGLQRLRPCPDSTNLLAGRGGEGEDGGTLLRGRWSCRSSRWQEAILSPSSKAIGQPLPPCALCCWCMASLLQAVVPIWRSIDSETVCSRCSTPSGVVPGGGAVDCARQRHGSGGEGAYASIRFGSKKKVIQKWKFNSALMCICFLC